MLSQVPPCPRQTELPVTSAGQQFSPHLTLGTKIRQLPSEAFFTETWEKWAPPEIWEKMFRKTWKNIQNFSPASPRATRLILPQLSASGCISKCTYKHFPLTQRKFYEKKEECNKQKRGEKRTWLKFTWYKIMKVELSKGKCLAGLAKSSGSE